MTVPVPSRIQPRRSWTSRPHGGGSDWPKAARRLYVHYTETPGRDCTTPALEKLALRNIMDFHVRVRGWDDVGYSYLVCQPWERKGPATIYVGRGARRIPASQQGANQGNWSVAVVANSHEHIMDRTIHAIAWLARNHLHPVAILPHSAQNSTDCPGRQLRGALSEIRRLAGLR